MKKKRIILLALFIIVLFVFQAFLGEKIIVNKGLGYDGLEYTAVSESGPKLIVEKRLDSYRLQRTLPSLLINYTFTFLKLPITDKSVLNGFNIFDLILLISSVIVWLRILKKEKNA